MSLFRVLVVDDEVFNCELLEMYLDLLGYESVTAYNGFQALELLDHSIDLVLMDVTMPGMTGFETTSAIRASEQYAHIPVIMVTALSSQADKLESVRVGANDYINKPVDELELRVRVEAQLKVKQAQDALRNQQEQLEQLVRERTQQLEIQNRELEAKNREIQATGAILEHALEGISRLDASGHFLHVNTAFAEMFGYSADEMAGMHWEQTLSTADGEAYRVAHQQMCVWGKADLEAEGICRDGSRFFMQAVFIAVLDSAEQCCGYYCFAKDVSERKAFEAKITYQAFHDALTGLANRSLFLNRLEFAQVQRRRVPRPIAVLFLDLDNFKVINDTLGHKTGDQVLITVAQRIKECISSEDTAARLAGDEFTLLLEDIASVEDATLIAERLLQQLHAPVVIQGENVSISASIGIAFTDQSYDAADDILRDADLAMYHAKMGGKSGYSVFNQTINASLRERMEIETELRLAIEKEQLRVYYQPLINLETGHFAGVEALVRWEHPRQGLLLPGQFIALAEETGLIIPLGYWVLEEACRQTKEWESLYPEHPFTVNVNISGKQLQQSDVVDRVRHVLEKTGLPPSKLKLEITESVMMTDMESIIEKMHAIKSLGVKLALDDFGTGYSSMSSLHAFPLDTVKIDRSFIQRLAEHADASSAEHADASSIVGAIIGMAKSLRMDVTGEGVETDEHVVQLQGMGCNTGQGYFFSHPVPATLISNMLPGSIHDFIMPQEDIHKKRIEQYLWSIQCGENDSKAA